jgi:LAO/AO transport system kinase
VARRKLTEDDYVEGVLAGDRAVLARAITLVESNRRAHQLTAQRVLQRLLPHTGRAARVGLTGVPGVGKSTFIEGLGMDLLGRGHRLAVLAIDPTSSVRGGSILGDKTRMARLSADPRAFIRPSPTRGSLGGVHRKTREAMLLCEAAGFDVVLVETVGVGQSETSVADMVDTFLVLMLPGAGDELQGIKKGILEVADVLAVNKADGAPARAEDARRAYKRALHLTRRPDGWWDPPVLTCSGLTGERVPEVWDAVLAHREAASAHGELERRRQAQRLGWMWSIVEGELLDRMRAHEQVVATRQEWERRVLAGERTPTQGALALLDAFLGSRPASTSS